jgi:DNA-binding response OmpR family regulator
MESPLILVIDDSPTIRKMVECHLSQAGYRVALAPDADQGVEAAGRLGPNLILLDHQLPGTTGDDVCRRLLASDATARIPVVISSAMRNRAFAAYTEFPNVVDQIPKPFTPELLKSGVANALQMGAMVVQAQRTGCAMPEAVGEVRDAILEGYTSAFAPRAVLDFLNNGQHVGLLTLEQGRDRIRFALASGRIQAVFSPTISPERLVDGLPAELADLAPLLAITLGEQQDASTSGLVRLLERSLSDPRRLRALLRVQAAVLTHWALTGEPGKFTFEAREGLPPMFQAFPLQASLPALAVEGIRRRDPTTDAEAWSVRLFARHTPRGGNLDRAGLSSAEMKIHTLLDGNLDLASIAAKAGTTVTDVADVVRGLELAGLAERKSALAAASILVLEDDPEAIRGIRSILGDEGEGYQLKVVPDRAGAQLLLRRGGFGLVLMGIDRPEQESAFRTLRGAAPATTRFLAIASIEDESELGRLDAMGLDGVVHRPLSESELRDTVRHLLGRSALAGVA